MKKATYVAGASNQEQKLKVKEIKYLITWHRSKREYGKADALKHELNEIYLTRRNQDE